MFIVQYSNGNSVINRTRTHRHLIFTLPFSLKNLTFRKVHIYVPHVLKCLFIYDTLAKQILQKLKLLLIPYETAYSYLFRISDDTKTY